MRRLMTAGALCAAALVAAPSQAAVIASLSFQTATGTVFSNESIPVYLILHLDENSDAITTDPFTAVTSGLTDEQIAGVELDPVTHEHFDPALVTRRLVNHAFQCGGNFSDQLCTGVGEYAFDFHYGLDAFNGSANLDLQPGSDTTWYFGNFNPIGGNAAPGTYTFYNAIFEFEFVQPDANGGDDHIGSINIAQTCSEQRAGCAFTRDVLAAPGGGVPEPATWALMILGFGAAGARLRRRPVARGA